MRGGAVAGIVSTAVLATLMIGGGIAYANNPEPEPTPTWTPSAEPTGPVCPVKMDGVWTDIDDALAPYAAAWAEGHDYVSTHFDFDTDQAQGIDMLTAMGCEVNSNSQYAAAMAIRELNRERPNYGTLTPNEGGGSGVDVNVNVDSPFYCSWSLRGGFNCGVRL